MKITTEQASEGYMSGVPAWISRAKSEIVLLEDKILSLGQLIKQLQI